MSLEATYEQGTLRLSQPITLEEGSKVQVIIIPLESNEQPKRTLEILKKIAELPLEGKIDTFDGKDHDQILYC
ncbi:MAG: antitoxin family protein [Woronichinia naegeliana WA131]|jgi:predicted DNA-binding antitoxin AbrB/MazE fold protein|uniref:Antitoxin family protein n=1 Tax=Woronichinia naegeliana WA131 TaxID=2824559 RepID=A0A977PXD0_9CYAN|nr:MAG: antitoxin family protein [Woronichinia naegeliana WA131]